MQPLFRRGSSRRPLERLAVGRLAGGRLAAATLLWIFVGNAAADGLADVSNRDAVSGLRAALDKGAAAAIAQLGTQDGFLGNAKVRIPLPKPLAKAEKALRMMGMGAQADELVAAMNHAAEQAVAEAKPLMTSAVKSMTVTDAKNILGGGDDSVTQFFKEKTAQPLAVKFLPIVTKATNKVGLAKKYNEYAGQAMQLGLIKGDAANIEQYVTRKALDGLYLMIAEQEHAIRQDPIGTGSKILQKVFGALR